MDIMKNKKYSNFLELTKSRKTTYEFSDKKVKEADLKKILEAARWAPSCSNAQPWNFVVIKDKERIAKIIEMSPFGAFHTPPPLIIAIVLNFDCWEESKHRCVKNGKLGTVDALLSVSMTALSMVLEAQDLGINTAFISPENDSISKLLKVRKNDSVPLAVSFGYEEKGAFQKKRERKEVKEIVFREYFGCKESL